MILPHPHYIFIAVMYCEVLFCLASKRIASGVIILWRVCWGVHVLWPFKEDCCTASGLLNEYLNISEHSVPEAGAWFGGQESPTLLKNLQLFHQVSEDSQHLFDLISGGLGGLWGSQCCWSTLRVAQASCTHRQAATGTSSLLLCLLSALIE